MTLDVDAQARHGAWAELSALHDALRATSTVQQLFVTAAVEALAFCHVERAAVLTIRDGLLTADGTVAIPDPRCDALRRRVLAAPVRLTADSEEAELIRSTEREIRVRSTHRSVLSEPLGLRQYALAPIAPDRTVVALLVADRSDPEIDADDRATVELFARVAGHVLERMVLKTRLGELCAELRHLSASAGALAQEVAAAPLALSTDLGWGSVFPATMAPANATLANDDILTTREAEIVELIADGRSNRDIARTLNLSPDTVKGNVARVMRKLGVSNRVEAAVRYLEMKRS